MARYDNMTHSLMPYDRRRVVLATERTPCRPVKAQVRNYVERARAYLLAVPFPTHFMLSVSLQVMSSQAFSFFFFHCRYLLFFRWRYLSLSHVPRKLGAITGRSADEKQSMHRSIQALEETPKRCALF